MGSSQTKMLLAQSTFGAVEKCRCGGYDISLPHIKFHLMKDDFSSFTSLMRDAREMESAILSLESPCTRPS